jgi:hypothetical protein
MTSKVYTFATFTGCNFYARGGLGIQVPCLTIICVLLISGDSGVAADEENYIDSA